MCYIDDIYAYILQVLEHQLKILMKVEAESPAMKVFMDFWTLNQEEVRSYNLLKLSNLKVQVTDAIYDGECFGTMARAVFYAFLISIVTYFNEKVLKFLWHEEDLEHLIKFWDW